MKLSLKPSFSEEGPSGPIWLIGGWYLIQTQESEFKERECEGSGQIVHTICAYVMHRSFLWQIVLTTVRAYFMHVALFVYVLTYIFYQG